jgi:hypothetical protein
MKLSELIKQLQESFKKYGDTTVTCYRFAGHVTEVESVSVKYKLKTKSRYFCSNYWNEDCNTEKEKGEMILGIE